MSHEPASGGVPAYAVFEVVVDRVQVTNVRGKTKRFGRTVGKRSDWKKAYVTLAEGHDIDFLGVE